MLGVMPLPSLLLTGVRLVPLGTPIAAGPAPTGHATPTDVRIIDGRVTEVAPGLVSRGEPVPPLDLVV